jgi:hypothetical protein
MCEICKNEHEHCILEKDYYSVKSLVQSNKAKVCNENGTNVKQYILKLLISSYEFLDNYYMIPWFMIQSLYYSIYDKDKPKNRPDFFFKSFFDEEFISYYSEIINQMKEGNINAKNSLENIRDKYNEEKLKINDRFNEQYSLSLNKIIINNSRMISHLSYLNSSLNALNENVKDIEIKYGQ